MPSAMRRPLFVLPLLMLGFVILMVSMETSYAAAGGAEVYSDAAVGSNKWRQLTFLMLGSMGLVLLFQPRAARPIPVWPILLPAALLMGYVFSSVAWSDDPSQTLKRGIVLLCMVAAGFGIGRTWDFRDFAIAITILASFFLLLSLGAEARYRTFLTGSGDYRFSGIFHPAKQAFNCGMLVLSSLTLYFVERRKLFLVIFAVAMFFLVITKARTGLAATLVASLVVAWPHLKLGAWIGAGFVAVWLGTMTLAVVGMNGGRVDMTSVATLGRDAESADPTKLTGRLPIWNQALGLLSERPLVGFGYGAFWTAGRLVEFERRNGWALTHSHSAYIETMLNLGVIVFALVMAWVTFAFVRSLRLSHSQETAAARLMSGLIVFAALGSLTETAFVWDGFEFLALVAGIGVLAFLPTPASRWKVLASARCGNSAEAFA